MAAKIFEVNDVLPATTQLRVHFNGNSYSVNEGRWLRSDNNNFEFILYVNLIYYFDDGEIYFEIYNADEEIWVPPFNGTTHNYMDIDTSSWTLSKRTISNVGQCLFTWEDLNAPSGYTITFNSNGGTTISDIEEATELPTLPIPTKSGYTFVAWYYESNFQTRAKAGDTIESNVTLYAKWHNLGSLFTEIADAIRSKDGTSGTIRDVDFGERVKQIQGAIELTQAEYDALSTKDSNTYYLIVEVE